MMLVLLLLIADATLCKNQSLPVPGTVVISISHPLLGFRRSGKGDQALRSPYFPTVKYLIPEFLLDKNVGDRRGCCDFSCYISSRSIH